METVAVDWSGAADARRQIALARARDGRLLELMTGRSREEVVATLVERADSTADQLAVGLDFAFSLPAWFLRARGLSTARELWELVGRQGEEWLAQSPPPFWGRPGRRKAVVDAHFRRTEQKLEPVAGIGVKSPFQIGGAGAVGTASLRGMPFLRVLQDAGCAIWPFDPPRFPLVVEIYPRLLTGPVVKSDRASREAYLARDHGDFPPELAELAAAGEDAFDAAVSAVVMSRHAGALAALPTAGDPVAALEGEIWAPPALVRSWREASRAPVPAAPAPGTAAPAELPSGPRPGAGYGVRYSAALAYPCGT